MDEPGTYVHFLVYNAFGKSYWHCTLYYHQQMKIAFLIRGWAKLSARIEELISEYECPPVPVECSMKPLIAIEGYCGYPHSWLLMKDSKMWAMG